MTIDDCSELLAGAMYTRNITRVKSWRKNRWSSIKTK
jgi:hypothetical protein